MSPPPAFPLFDLSLRDEEIDAVVATLRSGWLTMGPRTDEFEQAFAEHLGVRHAIAVSSATAGLHLAYLAAGVRPGDEVIVPSFTFVASAAAVRYCGATPVLADIVGDEDLGVDPDDVEARITPRTRAVCAVHYAGYPAAVAQLAELCRAHGIALVEDAAHAPSATLPGQARKLGTFGTAGVFSFFSNKVLSCGEGGLVATDDDDVAAFVRGHRSHAMTSGTWDRHRGHSNGYDVVGTGFNYRMDEPRAALLLARLPRLEEDIRRRRALVHRYRELLSSVDGVIVPYEERLVDVSSCYIMPLLVAEPATRDPLRAALLARHGVQTSVLYPAIHEFTAYRSADSRGPERSASAARRQVSLPLYPQLPDDGPDRVVEALQAELAELGAPV